MRIGKQIRLRAKQRGYLSAALKMILFGGVAPSFELPLNDKGAGEVNLVPSRASGSGTPTFTRATTAYTTLADGSLFQVASGVPRSCYSAAGVYLGYLAEGARTNLCLQSQTFANGSWGVTGAAAITEGTTVAPDGTATADTLALTVGAAGHRVEQTGLALSLNTTYTSSIYVKAGTYNFWNLSVTSDSSTAWFSATANLSVGTISQTNAGAAGTYTSSSIASVGSGWYRITVTGQISAGASFYIQIAAVSSATPTIGNFARESWTAAGSETGFLWGAQLEAASFASSYIPTTTAAVTRNADVLTYPLTSNYNPLAGTIYTESAQIPASAGHVFDMTLAAAAGTDRVYFTCSSTNTQYEVTSGGGNVASISASLTADPIKNVATFAANRFTSRRNTTNGATDTAGAAPGTMDKLWIGSNYVNGVNAFHCIKNFRIYPRALSDAKLIAMTA